MDGVFHPRGHDAHHGPRWESFGLGARHDDERRGIVAHVGEDAVDEGRLHVTACLVEGVELVGEALGAVRVAAGEQLDHPVGARPCGPRR